MDNSLKRSFPLEIKDEEQNEPAAEKVGLDQVFDQEEGVTRFLKEQKNPLVEQDDDEQLSDAEIEEGKMKDILGVDEDEDIEDAYDGSPQDAAEEVVDAVGEDEAASMINWAANISGSDFLEGMQDALENLDENSRGAVEDVLADLNGESDMREERGQRGAVEDVLRELNDDNEYGINEEKEDYEEKEQDDEPDYEEEDVEENVEAVLNQVLGEEGDDEEVPTDEEPEEKMEEGLEGDNLLDAVLEDQVEELTKLDQLAEQVLNG